MRVRELCRSLGVTVGVVVGAAVGPKLGLAEGAAVGARLGDDEGTLVGVSLGVAEGAGVGSDVAQISPEHTPPTQSEPTWHIMPVAHAGQTPPQSMSVSSLFKILLLQV